MTPSLKKLPDPISPEIKLGRYRGLGVKRNPVRVGELEIQNALQDLVRLATAGKATDQPAQLGNRVEIDFNLTENGRGIDGGKSLNHPLILGQSKFIPGFEEQIVGMTAGQTKKFGLQIPGNYYQKSLAGKKLDAQVTLKQVAVLIGPKLDDDFARSLGRFSGLDELKANVSQGLRLEKEAKERDRVRTIILDRIAESSEFEVPKVLIEERLDSLIRGFDEELHQNSLELGLYLAQIKKTQDELRNDWRSKAESQVKRGLVTRAVAEEENITVADEEIAREVSALVGQWTKGGMAQTLAGVDPEVIKQKIGEAVLKEKVLVFLEENNL